MYPFYHATSNPTSNLHMILKEATKQYRTLTGEDLATHPCAAQLENWNSVDAVQGVFQAQAQEFEEFRKGDKKLLTWLYPMVQTLVAVSGSLGDTLGGPFPPARGIFTGISVLLMAAAGVAASYDILVNLFERVQFFLQRLKIYTSIQLTTELTEISGKIMAEIILILALETKAVKQGTIKKIVKRLAGRTPIESALKRLDDLTQNEALMVAARNLRIANSIYNKVDVIEGDTNKLAHLQSREALRRWIAAPNFSINHDAHENRYRGTGAWFIQGDTFNAWKTSGSLLWVRGIPWSGKTVLCSMIIEDIKSSGDLMAFFYFDAKDPGKCCLRDLLSSILLQLCNKSGQCHDLLSRLYTEHNDGTEVLSELALVACLKRTIQILGRIPIYLVIDALDQCPNNTGLPSPREKVLRLLEDLITLQYSNLRVCVTSGLEHDIRTALEPLKSTPVSLHEENGHREDITYYVKSLVHEDREMRDWSAEDRHLVIGSLSERADGMFGWAACQLDTLRRSVPESISKALDELPTALYERYMRALEKIPDGKQERAHYLFQCLVASIRPLRTEEVEEIFALRFDRAAPPKEKKDRRRRDSEAASFSACSSLVDIVEAEDSQLTRFSHFSVKQLLTSTRLAKDGNISYYHTPPEPAHATLAEACLTVLVQDKVDDRRSPLVPYAAQHWFLHARFGNVATQPEVQSLMNDLFDRNKPHLRGWVRIYDIDLEGEQAARNRTVWQDTGSPLYYAVLCGLPSMVNDLINAPSHNINEKGGTRGTALHAALQNKDLRIAELLLEHGADVDAKDKFHSRPLEKVLDDNHIKALRLLLKRKANVNALDQCGWTPLRRASARGQLEVVRLLLQNGAQVNAADPLGWTALHLASINGHAKVTRLLLENAANMNARTKGDFTPLYVASSRGFIDVVRVLLRHGADVRLWGTGNQSPLRAALTQRHDEVAKLVAGNLEGW